MKQISLDPGRYSAPDNRHEVKQVSAGRVLRSGELAELAGISRDTLRHYERHGLLPSPPRAQDCWNCLPPHILRALGRCRRYWRRSSGRNLRKGEAQMNGYKAVVVMLAIMASSAGVAQQSARSGAKAVRPSSTNESLMSDCPMHAEHVKAQQAPEHGQGVDKRGDQAMGFSHVKTTHHFILSADGAVIQ